MLPPLGPDGKPIGPEMLAPVFPMNLIEQEVSTKRWIDIPQRFSTSSTAGDRRRFDVQCTLRVPEDAGAYLLQG